MAVDRDAPVGFRSIRLSFNLDTDASLHFARHPYGQGPYGGAMTTIDAGGARELVEAAVTAISVLGGAMAYCSGYFAAQALAKGQPPDIVARRVNEGIGQGFNLGVSLAIATLIIEVWS